MATPDPCERLLQFLVSAHLRTDLQPIVQQCETLAQWMLTTCPHNQELTLGLRALIEAKDNFCRAVLAQ
jgi:hypothetical protein